MPSLKNPTASIKRLRMKAVTDAPQYNMFSTVQRHGPGAHWGASGLFSSVRIPVNSESNWGWISNHSVTVSRSRLGYQQSSSGKAMRSEEHTSELQSLRHLVCRLL